jgi:hypothetical protein
MGRNDFGSMATHGHWTSIILMMMALLIMMCFWRLLMLLFYILWSVMLWACLSGLMQIGTGLCLILWWCFATNFLDLPCCSLYCTLFLWWLIIFYGEPLLDCKTHSWGGVSAWEVFHLFFQWVTPIDWKILSWNVRGMDDSRKWNAFRNTIEASTCVAFCFQETKKHSFDVSFLEFLSQTIQ